MTKSDIIAMTKQIGEGALLVAGSAITAYNLFAFSVTKKGVYYFKAESQTWLAIGVGLIVAGLMIRKWYKL